jgi:hypothetical protein
MNQNLNLGNPNYNNMMIPNNNHLMNMNQMNMNQMNTNNINLNYNFNYNNQFQEVEDKEENVGDIIPICKEEKEERKEIILIKSDFSKKRVRIPSYIRKNELYYIAGKFKCNDYSTIKLFHNTEILLNDDSSIDCISNGDFIKINEILDINDFYYKSLCLKHKNTNIINLRLVGHAKIARSFPEEITINEMINAFLMELKIPTYFKNNFKFIFNSKYLYYEDNKTLKDSDLANNCIIQFIKSQQIMGGVFLFGKAGKIININIEIKKGNLCLEKIETQIGTLDIIKDIYNSIQYSLIYLFGEEKNPKIKEKKIILASIEINRDDERTLSLIGVREDFKCEVFLI